MQANHPFIITHMTRALSSGSQIRNTLQETIDLHDTLKNDEEVILVCIMEWCPIRDRYSPMRNIPSMN